MQDVVIPQNIEAEQSVLGAMMIDRRAVTVAEQMMTPEAFYRQAHKVIFRAMLNLRARNEPVDMVTVAEELEQMGRLEDVGGVSYVTLLANAVPTGANIKFHAQIVNDKAFCRRAAEVGTQITQLANAGGDPGELRDKAEQLVLQLCFHNRSDNFVPLHDIVGDTMDSMGDLIEHNQPVTGLATGFADLDYLTAGLQPESFIILAARPSMGKTALALNIAENVALRGARECEEPKRVAFFSLEMSRKQLAERMICTESGVDAQALRPAQHTEPRDAAAGGDREAQKKEMLDHMWDATAQLAEAGIYIDDTPAITLPDLRSKVRWLKAEGRLDLIIVDYLQLMQLPHTGGYLDNRVYQVSEISRQLKALARELQTPVIALSQLSRSVEMRQNKRPMLSDLRESGSLEQDADIVMFLYREEYYRHSDPGGIQPTELIIAKHRNGPVGTVELYFKSSCTRFVGAN